MNSMTKRVSIALASTALAGGALRSRRLGVGSRDFGARAAHAVRVRHLRDQQRASPAATRTTAVVTTTVGYPLPYGLADHEGEAASWHGVSAARWYEDQVDEAASWHGVSAARWYEDQVDERPLHGVSAARWDQDQVVWSLNHS